MNVRLLGVVLGVVATQLYAGTPVAVLPDAAVRFDDAELQGALAGKPVWIALPGSTTRKFTMAIETLEGGFIGARGATVAGDRVMLFASPAGVRGDIYAAEGRFRLVRYHGAEYWIRHADYPIELSLGRGLNVGVDDLLRPAASVTRNTVPSREEPGPDGRYEVDLLVVYTPRFEASLGGRVGAVAEIQRLAFLANTYFENSAVPIRYRVLRAEKYTGTQESGGGRRNLKVLSRDPAIRAYRDKIGADLVVYLRTADGIADIAISSLFNGDDKNDPPQDVQPDRDAFLVSYGGYSETGVTVDDFLTAHELGHTFGGGHNYSALGVDGFYWKTYAHGKDCGQFIPGGRYVSVMSYGELSTGHVQGVPIDGLPTGNLGQFFETSGDFFSSPLIFRDGSQCGSEGATEREQADNVRAITEAAPYVAAYRKAKTRPTF